MTSIFEQAMHNHIANTLNHYSRQMGPGYILKDGELIHVGAIGYCINGSTVTLPFHRINSGKGVGEIRYIFDSSSMKRIGNVPITVSAGLPLDIRFEDEPHKFIDRIQRFNSRVVSTNPGMTILAIVLFVDEHEDRNVFQKNIPETIFLYEK